MRLGHSRSPSPDGTSGGTSCTPEMEREKFISGEQVTDPFTMAASSVRSGVYVHRIRRAAQRDIAGRTKNMPKRGQVSDLRLLASSSIRAGRPARACELLYRMGVILDNAGQFKRALAAYSEALELAIACQDLPAQIACCNSLGIDSTALGDYTSALEFHGRALELARDTLERLIAHVNLGIVYERLGNLEASLSHHAESVSLASRLGSKSAQCMTLGNVGMVSSKLGDSETSRICMEYHLRIQESLQNRGSSYSAAAAEERNMRSVGESVLSSQIEEGDEHPSTFLESSTGNSDDILTGVTVHHELGKIASRAGDHDTASSHFDTAKEFAESPSTHNQSLHSQAAQASAVMLGISHGLQDFEKFSDNSLISQSMLAVLLLVYTSTTIFNSASASLKKFGSAGATNEPCDIAAITKKFGYIQVSNNNNRYFYTIYESDVNPTSSPVFLYLAGGPGASSVGTAVSINGPCVASQSGATKNEYSWSDKATGIWVDAPGSTGFSVGPIEQTLQESIDNMVNFMKILFEKYPDLNRDVHLVGVSAAATYAAMVGMDIIKNKIQIDFSGVMIYSGGIIGPHQLYDGRPQMIKDEHLQIDTKKVTEALVACHKGISDCNSNGPGGSPNPRQCESARATCDGATYDPMMKASISPIDVRAIPGLESHFFKFFVQSPRDFLNNPQVQAFLGVSKTWEDVDAQVHEAFLKYVVYDTTFHLTKILDAGKKVLMVAGEYDYLTNAVGTLGWMTMLHGAKAYGDGLNKAPEAKLQFPDVGPVGTIKSAEFTNGARLAFIK
ncbi:hypothetical protein FOL47_009902, partial [Perkinsus chesapeaki]